MAGGRVTRAFADRAATRHVLPLAALVQAAAFLLFLVLRDELWQLFVLMAVAGLGVGAAFAAFPALIISTVPASETGSATSLNQVLRYVGFATGSALTATILAAATPAGASSPGGDGYGAVGVVGLAVSLLTAAVTWLFLGRSGTRPTVTPAERGPSGRTPGSAPARRNAPAGWTARRTR